MSEPIKAPPVASDDWRVPLRRGGLTCLAALTGFSTWLMLAPLDSAVVAAGQVAVESSRQIVQHFEGGIVKEILVRDGQPVKVGDLLFTLDDTQARAALDTLSSQIGALMAREARLLAEREKAESVVFPSFLLESTNPEVKRAITDEKANFAERMGLRKVQLNVLQNRIETFKREIEGLASEQQSSAKQIGFIDQELPGLKTLLRSGLVALGRVTALERERERLVSVIGRSVTDSAKADRSIGEANLQIAQTDVEFQKQAVADLIETRRMLAELRERFNVAREVVNRLEIRAPRTGVAQARRFATVGAVVRPGDVMVEIAPVEENLVIRAQVEPRDIDVLKVGQKSEVRFPNFKASETPLLFGTIKALSNDRIQDPANPNQAYFFVEVIADNSTLPENLRQRVRAGMPAEVIFPTGERSAARYLFQPIEDRLRASLRER